MRNTFLVSVTICLLIVVMLPTLAQDTCQGTKTVIAYGNGVLNTRADAERSKMTLAMRLSSTLPREEFDCLEFALAYNNTEGAIRDLFESTRQNIQTNISSFWRFLGGIDPLPDSLQKTFLDISVASSVAVIVNNDNLRAHVDFYRSRIRENKKVIVVAHSQGNFFANQAHPNLNSEEQRNFGIVSVANPDSFVAGKREYTTLFGDQVIRIIPGALPFNTINGAGVGEDPLGHNFIRAYMVRGSNSEARILSDIISTRDILRASAPGAPTVVEVPPTSTNNPPAPTASAIVIVEDMTGTSRINPNDPDAGQSHSFAITTAPVNGTARIDADGLVTYIPNINFNGRDSLVVTVTDSGSPSQSGTVTIEVTVSAVNEDPLIEVRLQ